MTERLFVSSVQKELAAERRAVRDFIHGDALLRRFFDVFLFEDLPASDRRADDLFLSRAQSQRGYVLGPGTPMPATLAHLDLLDSGEPSHAAVLLFGTKPQRFLPSSEVKCMHFHGKEVRKPIPSYQIFKGTVFELLDRAVDFVLSKLAATVGTRAESNLAPLTYEIPREAVSEAIVNAVAHRDYASNASVQVMLFADRLEVWNPGRLPATLSIEQLARPHASIPRNPLLAEPMFLARYVEKAGSGILDMIALCREAGLPVPGFRQEGGEFVQTLWRPESAEARTDETGQVTGQVDSVEEELSADVQRLLYAITGEMARRDIQERLGLKQREHFYDVYLTPALAAGLIERTAPDKPTSRFQRYRLTEKGRAWLAAHKQRNEQ
jgi:ATP-dependent DNA helicase RecG